MLGRASISRRTKLDAGSLAVHTVYEKRVLKTFCRLETSPVDVST